MGGPSEPRVLPLPSHAGGRTVPPTLLESKLHPVAAPVRASMSFRGGLVCRATGICGLCRVRRPGTSGERVHPPSAPVSEVMATPLPPGSRRAEDISVLCSHARLPISYFHVSRRPRRDPLFLGVSTGLLTTTTEMSPGTLLLLHVRGGRGRGGGWGVGRASQSTAWTLEKLVPNLFKKKKKGSLGRC